MRDVYHYISAFLFHMNEDNLRDPRFEHVLSTRSLPLEIWLMILEKVIVEEFLLATTHMINLITIAADNANFIIPPLAVYVYVRTAYWILRIKPETIDVPVYKYCRDTFNGKCLSGYILVFDYAVRPFFARLYKQTDSHLTYDSVLRYENFVHDMLMLTSNNCLRKFEEEEEEAQLENEPVEEIIEEGNV